MNDSDKKTLIIFITLIFLILAVCIFNMYKNRKLDNVDRKIVYIFDGYTYDDVYERSSELFFQAIDLIRDKNVFEYEKDNTGKIKQYSINNYNHYKKIHNFMIVTNTLASSEVTKYMDYKKIINHENNYYIESYIEDINNNYIGSKLDILSYDTKSVYLKSINYYCENSSYLKEIDNNPNCNYITTETNFTLVLENNSLRINNFEEIKSIVK